jgi:hypothetical protein
MHESVSEGAMGSQRAKVNINVAEVAPLHNPALLEVLLSHTLELDSISLSSVPSSGLYLGTTKGGD